MVTASTQDQWRLLDIQAHDTRLTQIAHREKNLPELGELDALAARAAVAGDEVVRAQTLVKDLSRELAKAEADVEQVRARAARDQSRLDQGQGSAKDLQALQHELGTLAQRQLVLEDVELEVMERMEAAQTELTKATAERDGLAEQVAAVSARVDAALSALAQERETEQRQRAEIVGGIPADLMAMYERIRAHGGTGAAKLHQRRCEGCRLELNATDLGKFRDASEQTVLRCEECGVILVRTADSGL